MHLWSLNIFNKNIEAFYEVHATIDEQTTNDMGATYSASNCAIWHEECTPASIDESGVCWNIVQGTSNHNFTKYRYLKKVS